MAETVRVSANTSTIRWTSKMGDVLNHQCHLLCCQIRLPVANATLRYATVATVYYHFRKWQADNTWLLSHQALHEQTRYDCGKEPSPTAAIIDSQSVKTTELAATRGFDGHKRVKGRKRHLVTDRIGIPLMVKVTDANVSDNQIAIELITEVFSWYITIQLVCADAAYRGELEDWLYLAHQCQLEITSTLGQKGFEVVPLRWIVERTFSWFGWFRRLTLDYERYPKTAETMVYIASIYLMRNRIK